MIKQQLTAYIEWAKQNNLKVNDYQTLKKYCYLNKQQSESKQGEQIK